MGEKGLGLAETVEAATQSLFISVGNTNSSGFVPLDML